MLFVTWATIEIIAPRFLIVILSAYKQIHVFVLVIQGNADLGPRFSESEVQDALDFCASLFKSFNQGVANDLRKHFEGLDNDQFSARDLRLWT